MGRLGFISRALGRKGDIQDCSKREGREGWLPF